MHHPLYKINLTDDFLLEYSYIIYHHALRESGSAIGVAREIATNSYIEDEKETIVKGIIIACYIVFDGREKLNIIHIHFNTVLFPNQTKYMKFFIKRATAESIGGSFR